MTFSGIKQHPWFRPALGALLSVSCGLALLFFSVGEPWVRASYDNLFRFGTRAVTNRVVVVLMDNEAYAELNQSRDQLWDRRLHTKLLNKLADDRCPLVVMDVFLRRQINPETDRALSSAMRRLSNVVLAAEQSSVSLPGLESARPTLPSETFLMAARTNWGVAWLDPDSDFIVRRHWPFPSPGPYPSLPWVAAEISGARLDNARVERWVRYYDLDTTWTSLSYHLALAKKPGFFRDKVVFLGNDPRTPLPDNERDEFTPPSFKWTGETVGGVKILATEYLNLMNHEALRRLGWPGETMLLIFTGIIFGLGLSKLNRAIAVLCGIAAVLAIVTGAVSLSFFGNVWFPWLIIVGGQAPCALIWGLVSGKPALAPAHSGSVEPAGQRSTIVLSFPEDPLPDAPEYELVQPPIGRGGFGKVWIVRNAIGQWQALKAVYASNFGANRGPYEAEFKGLQRFKPVSEKHPGLLRVELVSKMKAEGYFYYVMELGDAQFPGWEKQPQLYKPRDLENLRKQAFGRRLPVPECLRIVTGLADALSFLHQQGLTHRDVKPSNVIFVNNQPKLADVGLVSDIRRLDQMHTLVGTPGYMPPPPEKPGTAQADIYALGMVLYVISSGNDPGFFPDISTGLMERSRHEDFSKVNAVVLKACQPDLERRYQTTAEMLRDLIEASQELPAAKNF